MNKKLKKCGKNVTIGKTALLINPEKIEIGNNVRIDDFVKIVGGKGVKIGNYVHIQSFTSIFGGGEFSIGDFSTISCNCNIITGSDDFSGKAMVSAVVPEKYRNPIRGKISIGKHCILGTGVSVFPDITISDGAAVGSNSVVDTNLPSWIIYAGSPARPLKERLKYSLKLEKELLNDKSI